MRVWSELASEQRSGVSKISQIRTSDDQRRKNPEAQGSAGWTNID